ncbi:MAG: heavy metal translocating P-type ATPase, partial [Saezia sp.]
MSHKHQHDTHEQTSCCAKGALIATPTPTGESLSKKELARGFECSQWYIAAMDCPVEENMIRKKLNAMSDVEEIEFNLIQRVLTAIHVTGAQDKIIAAIAELDMKALPVHDNEDERFKPNTQKQQRTLYLAIGGLLLALGAELMHYMQYPTIFAALPSLIAIAMCGLSTYKKGWIAIRHAELNINALMSIAVTGAAIIGQWPEAAMVMALFTISELIEERSLDRARMAIRSLLQLAPPSMTVQQQDGSWQDLPPENVTIGSIARVRPGQRVALDGVITQGKTSIDQSSVTGESLPLEKTPGDTVFAGTLNTSGEFEFEVTSTTKNNTLARIIHAVEDAQSTRAPTQRFIDRFARYYTPAVVVIALLVAILPPLFMGAGWSDAIYKALVILVIACPCALVISTPVTIVSGLAAASKRGLLIKGGVYLENARHLRWLALDKTGTITFGKPKQTEMHVFESAKDMNPTAQAIAASLASRSDHPVSMAVAVAAQESHIALHGIDNFEAISGQGTKATFNGIQYQLGNMLMTKNAGLLTAATQEQITAMEKKGQTVVVLSSEKAVLALFAVSDAIKPESK